MDRVLACLADWMPRQRWYSAASHAPRLEHLAVWDLPSPDPGARVQTHLVADVDARPVVVYQVPVVLRATPADDAGLIGSPEPGVGLIDGPHDPAYATALLTLATSTDRVGAAAAGARGVPATAIPALAIGGRPRVLSGEQSNTSIIYSGDHGLPVICKVFRQVHPGRNPDIELQSALAGAGSPHVPRAVGSVEGEWVGRSGAPASGSLAFAQEFLPGVEDAWRVARHAARAGEDFTERARALGSATAEVHGDLARLFPVGDPDADGRTATHTAWERRLAIAIAEVPEVAAHGQAIAAAYRRAADVRWPAAQRIHGDYHLGQVLQVPDRGWVLLDFEGEPMRPMRERIRPDLAVRDVAGMLRSFDYVAGSLRQEDAGTSRRVRAWAQAARAAFLRGYEETAGVPVGGPLLDAFELDKAVYEAIYEARNRPAWLSIPLDAIALRATPASREP